MIVLRTEKDTTSVSANGNSYDVKDGRVEVLDEDAAILFQEFGFAPVPLTPEAESAQKVKAAAPKVKAATIVDVSDTND